MTASEKESKKLSRGGALEPESRAKLRARKKTKRAKGTIALTK